MKKSFYIVISALLLLDFLYGCKKNPELTVEGTGVEIYQLENFETESGTDRIIESSVILSAKPIICYNEIISYNPVDHYFNLTESVKDKFNQEGGLKYHFKAFAITVDKNIVYTGYFWPSYASSIKQWYEMDPILYSENNKLYVQLAYPSDSFAGNYPDLRNDLRIINVLDKDGKLKK
jgi:hypothetical protein